MTAKMFDPPRVAVIDGDVRVDIEFVLRAFLEEVARYCSEEMADLHEMIHELETGQHDRREDHQIARIDDALDRILKLTSGDLILGQRAAAGLLAGLLSMMQTAEVA